MRRGGGNRFGGRDHRVQQNGPPNNGPMGMNRGGFQGGFYNQGPPVGMPGGFGGAPRNGVAQNSSRANW
jgi:hypothetical protein